MIQDSLLLILGLLVAVCMLTILANKMRISYPIFLVIAGTLICFFPGVPFIRLDPDLVFLVFLPPLLYSAAWNTSWCEFWKFKRPITLLAVGLVIFTSSIVAIVSSSIIPNFTLAQGFLLGAIISPPDAVAATSVLQNLNMPKRLTTILEGESLINDASSLIVFRFALAVIFTGKFSFAQATGNFFFVAGVGILVGVAIAYVFYLMHKKLPTNANIDTALTLIAPYLMYVGAEHFHTSGVMAVVSGGLFLSSRSHRIFGYDTRIQAYSIWDILVFLFNGFVFILIGLQLPTIMAELGSTKLSMAISYGLLISATIIVIRIVWVYPGAYIPRWLIKSIRENEPRPTPKAIFLIGWSGMRGVVSLASALAVPLTLQDGTAFPNRNLILFITFVVILITLVGQGLSLSWLSKKLGVQSEPEEHRKGEELEIRIRLAEAALEHMDSHYAKQLGNFDAYTRLRDRYARMIELAKRRLENDEAVEETANRLPEYRKMLLEIVDVRRYALAKLREEKKYDDELINNREWELDLEEARLNEL